MSKRLTRELEYDATAAEVFAMLADPSFREEVCRQAGVLSAEVDVQPPPAGGEGMEVTITQVQATAGVPSFAKKVVGDTTTVVQHEVWTSQRHADVTVSIPGKPGEITGTVEIAEAGGATTETVDLRIAVRIPLVGGKLEDLVAKLLGKQLAVEHRVGEQHLAP